MSDRRTAYFWGRAALLLAPLLFLDWEVYGGWARGEYTIKPAIVFWWLLLPFHLAVLSGAVPDALSPGAYPPPPPAHPFLRRWTASLPSVPYGCVFPAALLAVAAISTAASVVTADGQQWTVGGVVGMVVGGTLGAAGLGWVLRSRPRLEVDEVRRELVWRPDTPLGERLVLPFGAVVGVEVASDVVVKEERHRLEIRWRSNKGREVATQLPTCANRASVEAVAARVREALGLAG